MSKTLLVRTDLEYTTREAAMNGYAVEGETRISHPGKFEGEPIFAPYYWSMAMEGLADGDDGRVFTFRFKSSDRDFVIWPELRYWLGRKRALRMWEDSQGFVHCS